MLLSSNDNMGLEIKVYNYENVELVDGRHYVFCTEPCFAHASSSTVAFMHRQTKTNLKLWVNTYSFRGGFVDKD